MILQVKSKDRRRSTKELRVGEFNPKEQGLSSHYGCGSCKNLTYFYYFCRENEFKCDEALVPVYAKVVERSRQVFKWERKAQ